MFNGPLSKASPGGDPPSSAHATLVHPALFLLWYTLTSLTLLLPGKDINIALGHTHTWLLLITALQEELSRLCTRIPHGRREEYLYIAAGQRCIDAADLTPKLFTHYERARQLRMFSLRERGMLAVRASLYLDLLLYTKKTVYMMKTYGTDGLRYCNRASALRVYLYTLFTLVKYGFYSCFWTLEVILWVIYRKALRMLWLIVPALMLYELHWMFPLSLEFHLVVSDLLLDLLYYGPLILVFT